MNVNLTSTQLLAAIGVLLVMLLAWRWSARRARKAADAARASVRAVSLAGRVVGTAALIVGVQWLVITHPSTGPALLLALLAGPDLLAGYVLIRALTITTTEDTRRGDRR